MNHIEISKDVKIPVLGFGVFQIPQEQTAEAVKEAIKAVIDILIQHKVI